METNLRIEELLESTELGLTRDEIIHENGNLFSSTEYYLIIHLTNAEYYYTSDEEINNYNHADTQGETKKGYFYAFK